MGIAPITVQPATEWLEWDSVDVEYPFTESFDEYPAGNMVDLSADSYNISLFSSLAGWDGRAIGP